MRVAAVNSKRPTNRVMWAIRSPVPKSHLDTRRYGIVKPMHLRIMANAEIDRASVPLIVMAVMFGQT